MQTQSQGLTSRSWDSEAGDMAVLQTAVLFSFDQTAPTGHVEQGSKLPYTAGA